MKKYARAYLNSRILRTKGCCSPSTAARREDHDSYQPRLATGNTLTHLRKTGRAQAWMPNGKP